MFAKTDVPLLPEITTSVSIHTNDTSESIGTIATIGITGGAKTSVCEGDILDLLLSSI
jgi:hypothetical protein